MDIKKKAFLDAYSKSFGNITQSCQAIGVNRKSYYRWLDKDPEFAQAIKEAEPDEAFLDFCESKLMQHINNDEVAPLLFALKTKGKKRGYVERHDVGLDAGNLKGIELIFHEAKSSE